MVIDYWKLNDVTIKDFYPLPNLQGKLEKLSAHQLFSKFDVWVGYNNIHIEEEDQYKAAFKTPFGTFIVTGCWTLAWQEVHMFMNQCRHWLPASLIPLFWFWTIHFSGHRMLEALHTLLQVWAVPYSHFQLLMRCHLVTRHHPFYVPWCVFLSVPIPPFIVLYWVSRNRHDCCKCARVVLPCPVDHFILPWICM